jgi:hypothetical protein
MKDVAERHIVKGRLLASAIIPGHIIIIGPHRFRVDSVRPLHIYEWMPQRIGAIVTGIAEYAKHNRSPHALNIGGHFEDIGQGRNFIVDTNFVFEVETAQSTESQEATADA